MSMVAQRGYSPASLVRIMVQSVIAGMMVVQRGQREAVGNIKVKHGDGENTVVTKWDEESERAMLRVLRHAGINVYSEEAGFVKNAKVQQSVVFVMDPLDGSNPFAVGAATSTISIGLYDTVRRMVVAVVVGEPATGKIFCAEEGQGAWLLFREVATPNYATAERLQVWQGPYGSSSVTLVDCYHNFKLEGYPTIPNAVWGRLVSALNEQGVVYNFGTNCGHHALVALGRANVRGAITTCRGGPHDIAAGLLVTEAGGVTRCFDYQRGVLVEVGRLAVLEAVFMISAVNEGEAEKLVTLLKECLNTV